MTTKDGSPVEMFFYNCTGRSELREKEGKKKENDRKDLVKLHVLPCIDLLQDKGAVTIVSLHSLM